MLWVPTALQVYEQAVEVSPEVDVSGELASSEELSKEWGTFGMDWSWAHNGTKQNGWFRLCRSGQLMSKWGPGNWQLLRPAEGEVPLLLVTFNGVEHALRLMEGKEALEGKDARFDVVCMRRIKDGQQSLSEDPASLSRVSEPSAPAVCTAQGWPGLDA